MTVAEPRVTYLEDEFIYVWDDLDVQITFERFREERGELKADASPQSASGLGHLPGEKLNLTSARSIKMYANTLAGHGLLDGDTWFECLTKCCRDASIRYREGEPPVVLADVDWQSRPGYMVEPFITRHGTTIGFGDGGVSKSLHALALLVSVATGAPLIPNTEVHDTGTGLYLDWEADDETHAERLGAICAGAGIEMPRNIIYMRRSASLAESVREVRKVIALNEVKLCVVDSIGAAAGGDPEKADTVIRAFMAMRSLGVPVFALHHVTKDSRDKTKPFGSVFGPNLARLTWRVDRDQEEGEASVRVRWTNYKSNFGRIEQSRGHGVVFEEDEGGSLSSVRFVKATDVRLPEAKKTARPDSLQWSITKALKDGARTVHEIAKALQKQDDTIRTQLNRHKESFVKVGETDEGSALWGVLSNTNVGHTNGTYQGESDWYDHTRPVRPPLGALSGGSVRREEEEAPQSQPPFWDDNDAIDSLFEPR